jgi:RHS repeat-associated protein
MGNTLFLTDDAGSISDSYAYTPYGAPVTSLGLTDNPFTFGGRHGVHRLGLTNLYVMCRRVYDSSNATFLSREPSVQIDPRLVNPYQYAAANPLYFIDPTGREPEASPAHEPGTGAGVETAVTVVGKSADVAVQVGEHLSEGKKITEALVHASDYIQIDNVKEANDVFKVVMKDAPKVAKGEKIVKVAAPIKTAAQVAEGGLIVKEFIDARDEAFHEDEIRTSTSEKLYNKLANRANALYDRKLIGAARKNNLIKKALIDLTYDQAVSNSVLDLELTAQFGVGVKNAVGTLVPIPKPVLGWFGLNPEDKLKKK